VMLAVLVGATAAAAEFSCNTDVDCSLNGECTMVHGNVGVCLCDKPWSGEACDTMKFLPVSFPQGYGMAPNHTVWGGSSILDPKTDLYHAFISSMTNGCPLSTWTQNSRIDHAVSKKITGPYEFVDVAIPTWAHNSAPVALKDGSFAIFHIGTGTGSPNGGKNCSQGVASQETAVPWVSHPGVEAAGSTIHTSRSLEGPWSPLLNSTLGGCNNPAPWVHRNGTIFLVCGNTMLRAEDIAGPWASAGSFSHSGGPRGTFEDPYLYTTSRGWHLLYHVYDVHADRTQCVNSTVSAHVFSVDGHTWHTAASQPYSTQVAVNDSASGEVKTITVATRERPKLHFDTKTGQMTHLFNGVCSATACPEGPATGCVDCKYASWDYTLVAPLDV